MSQTAKGVSRNRSGIAQVWIRLRTDDPAAVSASSVVKRELADGAGLRSLQRWRMFELTGSLPADETLQRFLHASTQFFNPHKETCRLRMRPDDESPVGAGTHGILVLDRDATRRPAAERWWRQETGKRVAVREGLVWVLEFESDVDGAAAAQSLSMLRDRRHGLFCNPHSQDVQITHTQVPLPWIATNSRTGVKT